MTGFYRCPQCLKIVSAGDEIWGTVKEKKMAFCSEACLGKYEEVGSHG